MKIRKYKILSRKSNKSMLPSIKWKRLRVIWRKWIKSLDKSITMDNQKLSPYQEKAIKLWRLCIKDENTKMAYNTLGIRQIEKGNLFITYTPEDGSSYIMTIMDISDDRKNLFEIHIPSRYASYALDVFDTEMEKRMKKVENKKRLIIESDIDKLLKEEEKLLIQRQKINKKN